MNREALFCDGTQDYVIPAEPKENEKIKIRFRTAHNDVEEVHILTAIRRIRCGRLFRKANSISMR